MSNYWKKKLEELEGTNQSGSTTSKKTGADYWKQQMDELEAEQQKKPTTPVKPTVTTKKEDKEKKKGLFDGLLAPLDDGWDAGDIASIIMEGADRIGQSISRKKDAKEDKDGDGLREASWLDATVKSAKRGYYNSLYGEETFSEMLGKKSNADVYRKILEGDEYQFEAEGTVKKAISGAAELLGQQARQFTHPRTLATTGTAATMAAIAGQAGPQVLAPEEIITVPAAAIVGFKAGSAASNLEIEAGNAYNEMIENGISEETAKNIALTVGGVNAGLDLLQVDELFKAFKVLNKTGATDTVVKRISKELWARGIDVAKETAQEVAQEGVTIAGVQAASKKDKGEWAYTKEDVASRLGETAMSSALSFGAMNVPAGASNVVQIVSDNANAQKLTENEQKVIDKEIENRIAEKEKDGKKLTNKEKAVIEEAVIRDMDRGYISTDTIEEVLGGETYKTHKDTIESEKAMQEEYDLLYKMKNGEKSDEQIDRQAELKQKLEDIKQNFNRNQLGDEVMSMVKGDRLVESYNERIRQGQDFVPDFEKIKGAKYEDAARKTLENAASLGMNNTNKVHDIVDFVTKIAGDTGNVVYLKTNEQIKAEFVERQTAEIAKLEKIENPTAEQTKLLEKMKEVLAKVQSGETKVNGNITEDGIVLNLDSDIALNRTVGHEVMHSLEKAKHSDAYRKALFSYAKTKGVDIDGAMAERKAMYAGISNAQAEAELVADMTGEYLFSDEDFVRHLSVTDRNVFQKIYDEIKYLCKIATAGSKEARELERVKRTFEKIYREGGKQTAEDGESNVQYSLVEDQKTIDFLENQDYITTYKAMAMIDGKLYPPMASQTYVDETYTTKNGETKTRRVRKLKNPSVLGKWQKSDERIDIAEKTYDPKKGYSSFDLLKSNGKTTGGVAYNPYEHTSNIVLNDQFAEAYQRPELVTVEYRIPVSELTSGYKAQYAKDPVGLTDWKAGGVAQKLKHSHRDVYLTRWSKPVRILDDAEVAQKYKEILDKEEGISVPWNVVTPSLRTELEKIGVPIDYSDIKAGSTVRSFDAFMRGEYDKPSKKVNYSLSDSDGKPTADKDVSFSLSESVEQTKDLVALHNLTAEKLTKSLQLGGLPMPSLAITKADIPHSNFGDITLIFGRETIDPKVNRKNKVYSADAWTPVFPRVEYEADSKVSSRISQKLRSLEGSIDDTFHRDIQRLQYGYEDYLNSDGGEEGLIQRALDNYGLKAAYLEEQGKHINKVTKQQEAEKTYNPDAAERYLKIMDILGVTTPEEVGNVNMRYAADQHGAELEAIYPGVTKSAMRMGRILNAVKSYLEDKDGSPVYHTVTDINATKSAVDEALDAEGYESWVRDLFSGIVKDSGIYNNKELFTPSGNRRSFKQTHLPVTLENIVKAMAGQNDGNSKNVSGFNGVKTLRAATAETFKSVDQMHQRKERLQNRTQEEADALNDELQNRLFKVMEAIDNESGNRGDSNPYIRLDSIGETLTEIGESGKFGIADIQSVFQQYGKTISDDTAMEVKQLLYDVTQMPVNIFEAKPERVVGFDEAKVFVIPNNADVKLKQELLNRGYSIAEYDPNIEGHRQQVVNQFEEYKFSLSDAGYKPLAPLTSFDVFGRDLMKVEETAPVQEAAPVREDVAGNANVTNSALYNMRDGKSGWGNAYATAQEALNDAVQNVNTELWDSITTEIENATDKKNYPTPMIDALVAVQEDVRQDTITPMQGAQLLSEAYKYGGENALRGLYNPKTGNLYDKYLKKAKQYETVAPSTEAMFPDDLAPVEDIEAQIDQVAAERNAYEEQAEQLARDVATGVITPGEYTSRMAEIEPKWEEADRKFNELVDIVMAEEREASERLASLDDADIPPEIEAPYGETQAEHVDNPFENRDYADVGKRNVKAYMYENPEVKPFFQTEAEGMLGDLLHSIKGEKWYNDRVYSETGGEFGWGGTKRHTTDDIAYLLDQGYTYAQIEKGLNAIIEDNGAENNAVSKRIEFALNDRLLNGYRDLEGRPIPPNEEYINLLNEKQINEYSKEAFDAFMANADSYAPPVEEDIAPVVQPVQTADAPVAEAYEAIRPKPEKQPKLAKATPAEQARAQVLTEEPKVDKKKPTAWNLFKDNFVDKGTVFETLSLKTGNRELQGRWKSIGRAESSAQWFMEHGNASTSSLKSIRETVENSGKSQQFYEYLYHLHNVDRMNLEDRYDDVENKPVFGYDVTSEMSKEEVAKLEAANPEFKEWSKEVYDYMTYLREMMVDDGVISRETANLWAEMYPHYVPIRRKGDEGLNINVALDTKRTGVNAPIKKATGGNRDILPLFDTMAMRTEQTFKAVARNRFGVELKNMLGTTIENEAVDIDEAIDSVETELLQEGKDGRNPTFTVFENGEKVTFEITDEMYNTMKPKSDAMSYTNKVLNKANNIRRGLLTEYNPAFMLTNPIKDTQDVLMNSQHPARTYANYPKAMAELWNKNGQYYQEYMEHGGEQNTYFDGEAKTFTEEKSGFKKIIGFPLEKISQANNFIERIPRMAEYIASRKMGRSIDVSMLDAARVTTDFSAGGDLVKMLNRNGFTFLNASVQGAAQQVRNVREAKAEGLKGWAKLATKVAVAGLPAMLLNHLLWDDDEDYEELSDYVKQNYYIVGKYGDGKFVRIPKGRALAVIQYGFKQMENLITGNDEVDLDAFAELVISNLAPNNPLDNNLIAPIMQAKSNTTWYGDDLVPTRLQDLPAAEQYDETTDSLSKWLGETLNISPYKINYLLDQYSGAVGDVFLPMMTPEAERGNDSLVGDMIAPISDKFTTDSTLKNQNVSDFYTKKEELTVKANASGATDEDVLMSKYMNSVNSDLAKLYAEKREIQNSNLPNAKKYAAVRDVQKQIVELTKEALNSYEDISYDGDYANIGNYYYQWYTPEEGDPYWRKLTESQTTKYLVTKDAGNANYATNGTVHYRRDEDGKWTKISDKDLARQREVTRELGITPEEYWSETETSFIPMKKGEYEYAYENPGKYGVAKVVGGYDTYMSFSDEINSIKDNNDSDSGIKDKDLVTDYINGLDLDYGQKIILYRSLYDSKADRAAYDSEIFEYLETRDDLSYEEKIEILKKLGFEVSDDGYVTW